MYNKAVLVGRMANDPELKFTPSGVAVTTFRIAVNRSFKGADGTREADFLDVVAWRQQAEFASSYLGKGRLVLVEGRIQVREYEKDGQKRKVWEIVADNIRGLDRPKEGAENTAPAPAGDGGDGGDMSDPFAEE